MGFVNKDVIVFLDSIGQQLVQLTRDSKVAGMLKSLKTLGHDPGLLLSRSTGGAITKCRPSSWLARSAHISLAKTYNVRDKHAAVFFKGSLGAENGLFLILQLAEVLRDIPVEQFL